MIIKHLELVNFQVIKEFKADFDGGVYFITGDNEKGKSTILKSILALLTGERDDVLTNGEKKGFAKMVVGNDGENYEVELRFTEKNPRGSISIKAQSSGMKSDNISMLQKIFGYTDFDAVEFSRWSETAEGRRKQIEAVKALLPAKIQNRIDEIDTEVKTKKDARKDVNSEVKTYTAIVEASEKELPTGDLKKYNKPIDISDLMKTQSENAQLIEKAKTARIRLEERKNQLAQIPDRIKAAEQRLSNTIVEVNNENAAAQLEYERVIKEAKARLDQIKQRNETKVSTVTQEIEAEKQKIETDKSDIETKIQNANNFLAEYEKQNVENSDTAEQLKQAELHNKFHSKVVDFRAKKEQKELAEKKAEKLENEISDLLKERETLISKSKLPVKGLTFTDDGLELNGVPLVAGKVSDSQIMEVAAQLIIASNPTVKVFRIARGESLGENRLKSIIEIAQKNGFQGFIEEVKRGQDDLIIEEYTEQ